MNTAALERHIIDTVKEWQMKIGYRSEEMKLYYPDVSLAGLLELADGWTEASLKEALQEFSKETKERLGGVRISNVGERYCVAVPAAGCITYHRFSWSDFQKLVSENTQVKHQAETCIMCQ